jgi:hypothetical protein
MRRLYLLFFFFTPIAMRAQDITGIWQGHFRSTVMSMRSSVSDDRYRFEVQIAQKGKLFEGVTYSYLSSYFYGKAAATGSFNVHSQKVLLQEGKILEFRNSSGDICIMTCFLQYSKSSDEEFLEGTYVSMNTRDSSNCGRGTVFLRKVKVSDFYTEPIVLKREKEIAGEDSAKTEQKIAGSKPDSPTHPGVTALIPHSGPKPGTTATTHHSMTGSTVHHPATGTGVKKPATDSSTAKTGNKGQNRTSRPATVSNNSPEPHTPQPRARATVPGMSVTRPVADSNTGTGMGKKFPSIVPAVLRDRENEHIRTLVLHTTEVTLNIYDDGAIDHDTVSVYLDNRQVVNHAMLTDRPIVVTLHLDEDDDYHEIVMVAENEGEIPPNTSLMIVKAGDKEYEVRITTTEQKNAVIKFKYAK